MNEDPKERISRPYRIIDIVQELNAGRDITHIEHEIMLVEQARAKEPGKKMGQCATCGNATVLVEETGMCGPCTFGESETAYGNWYGSM